MTDTVPRPRQSADSVLTTFATALTLCAFGSTACSSRGPAPALHPPVASGLGATLDAQVPALLEKYRAASIGVAVIEEGRVVLERAYGEQSPGVPATAATLYNLASVTKPVTAEVLLRLVAAGRLSLDESMSTSWVDPDVADDPRQRLLTLRIALAHQTGLPNWRGRSPGGRLAFAFAPGTAYAYSGEGYDYAARFAERKLGQNFEALAQAVVFEPLGMTSTSYSLRGWMRGRLSSPRDTSGRWGETQMQDSAQWNAGNNMLTTAGDYAKLVASVMRGDGLPGDLAAERLRPAVGPQDEWACQTAAAVCPRSVSMALGWRRIDYPDGPVFTHTGRNDRTGGGERTLAYFDPRRRRGVVLLTSGTNGERLYHDVLAIIDPGAPVVAYLRPPDA